MKSDWWWNECTEGERESSLWEEEGPGIICLIGYVRVFVNQKSFVISKQLFFVWGREDDVIGRVETSRAAAAWCVASRWRGLIARSAQQRYWVVRDGPGDRRTYRQGICWDQTRFIRRCWHQGLQDSVRIAVQCTQTVTQHGEQLHPQVQHWGGGDEWT